MIVGLNVLRIINELIVVVMVYGFDKNRNSDDGRKNILVFDLGGGIFDVSLLLIDGGIYEVKVIVGNIYLGGEDFNNNIVEYLIK